MSDHTLIALSREVAALTVERDRLQQENEILSEHISDLESNVWERVVRVGTVMLDQFYPPDIFTGESGDAGPTYVVALREALKRQSIAEAQVQALDAAASWQNIATAPKDGTRVDLWAKMWRAHDDSFMTRRFPDCYWVKRTDMSNVDDHWGHLDNGWMPTHWTLQPAPPAASRREEEPT